MATIKSPLDVAMATIKSPLDVAMATIKSPLDDRRDRMRTFDRPRLMHPGT
jgi:hypothetical protein